MPTLLSSTSTRPHLARQASTIALTWVLLDASHSKEAASPPSLAINPTVSSAAARLRSTQNTLAPSRAKVTAVHLPLPQPGPLEPAPTTIATLSFNLPAMSATAIPSDKIRKFAYSANNVGVAHNHLTLRSLTQ